MSYGESRPVESWRVSTAWKRLAPLVKRRAHNRCEVCGDPEIFHRSASGKKMSNLLIGHRTPPERYAGSPLDPGNLFCLCRACNASQGNRTEAEWRAARSGRLVGLGLTGPKEPTTSAVITTDYTRRPE
jgi:5-methylcytosine-specific restriction endonuclease McrA